MKKTFCLCLCLCLLLTFFSCARGEGNKFERAGDGVYRDTKTKISYTVLPSFFEPQGAGAAVGYYRERKSGFSLSFFEVPGAETALYVADEYLNVYKSTPGEPDPSMWKVSALHICEEGEITVETVRFAEGKDAATIGSIVSLWFDGTPTEEDIGETLFFRSVKLQSPDEPGLFYRFYFERTEKGAYFTQPETDRVVAVPASLAELFGGTPA